MNRWSVLIFSSAVLAASVSHARSVFINGVDVSSGKNIQLKNVQVTINEHGDIHISAPQYDVNEEDNFTPLSRFVHGSGTSQQPVHKPMQAFPTDGHSSAPTAPAHDSVPKAGTGDDSAKAVPEVRTDKSPEPSLERSAEQTAGKAAAGG
jgi:hypothetical protein